MLKLTTTIIGADLSVRGAKKALRAAQDFGLKWHRRQYMPLHFETVARMRYPEAYKQAAGKYSRSGTASTRKHGKVRRDVNKQRRQQRSKEANQQQREERIKRPVYDTGLTRQKILRGGVKVTGRYDKRGMKFNPPFYISINPAGQLNKVEALNAIHPSEESKDAALVEKMFFKNLAKKKTTKKG